MRVSEMGRADLRTVAHRDVSLAGTTDDAHGNVARLSAEFEPATEGCEGDVTGSEPHPVRLPSSQRHGYWSSACT